MEKKFWLHNRVYVYLHILYGCGNTLRDIDAALKLSSVECLEWEWKVVFSRFVFYSARTVEG